ncbi:MAG TPA: phage major capsid protein [Bradyrhizobium sp.]|nr:phage major capsid protein [Bradyrhizobium sp.]
MNYRQTRTFAIRAAVLDDDEEDDISLSSAGDGKFFPATISTDSPIDRGGYSEVLSHAKGAINLSRAPLPILEGHDSSKAPMGLIENLSIANGRLSGDIRFGASKRAKEIAADVRSGIIRSLSVGYSVDDQDWDPETNTAIANRWTPMEASVVACPADISAKFLRSFHMNDDTSAGGDGQHLSRSQRKTQTQLADQARERAADIAALAQKYGMQHRTAEWLESGVSLEHIREEIMESKATRNDFQFSAGGGGRGAGLPDHDGQSRKRSKDSPIPVEELRKYSLLRAIRSMVSEDRRAVAEAGFELEVSRTLADHCDRAAKGVMVPDEIIFGHRSRGTRALTTGVANGDGGNITSLDFLYGDLIDTLNNQPQVISLGARVMGGLTGNAAIPRMTAGSSTNWIGEGDDYGDTAPQFDHPVLTMHDLAARVDITRRLMIQSTPAADELVRSDLALRLSIGMDLAAITGPGNEFVPLGLLNTPGVGVVSLGGNGLAPSWNAITEVIQALATANGLRGNLGWLTNGAVMGTLMRTPMETGFPRFIWEAAAPGARPDEGTIGGYRALVSNNVPSNLTKGSGSALSAMIFGNWSDLIIGQWRGIDIQANPYILGKTGTVQITAIQSCDFLFRHPESFVAILDAVTT